MKIVTPKSTGSQVPNHIAEFPAPMVDRPKIKDETIHNSRSHSLDSTPNQLTSATRWTSHRNIKSKIAIQNDVHRLTGTIDPNLGVLLQHLDDSQLRTFREMLEMTSLSPSIDLIELEQALSEIPHLRIKCIDRVREINIPGHNLNNKFEEDLPSQVALKVEIAYQDIFCVFVVTNERLKIFYYNPFKPKGYQARGQDLFPTFELLYEDVEINTKNIEQVLMAKLREHLKNKDDYFTIDGFRYATPEIINDEYVVLDGQRIAPGDVLMIADANGIVRPYNFYRREPALTIIGGLPKPDKIVEFSVRVMSDDEDIDSSIRSINLKHYSKDIHGPLRARKV